MTEQPTLIPQNAMDCKAISSINLNLFMFIQRVILV